MIFKKIYIYSNQSDRPLCQNETEICSVSSIKKMIENYRTSGCLICQDVNLEFNICFTFHTKLYLYLFTLLYLKELVPNERTKHCPFQNPMYAKMFHVK